MRVPKMNLRNHFTSAAISLSILSASLAEIALGTDKDTFLSRAEEILPVEKPYDYHKTFLSGSVHRPLRSPEGKATDKEMVIEDSGWRIQIPIESGPVTKFAANDLQEFFKISMSVDTALVESSSLADWQKGQRIIFAGTPKDLPGMGADLKKSKDYEIQVTPDRIVVCGYDERGVMFGLFNLESRMGLREGPYLPKDLSTVRHSLYQNRMAQTWLGWMQWPDKFLSHMAHDGYDAIFASVYANPNGVAGPPHYDIIRKQDPKKLNALIKRAAEKGLKVYTPILFNNSREEENKQALREHVRDIVTKCPDIKGYVLLTEGFYFEKFFGAGGHGKSDLNEWATNWTEAVKIVAEECHKIDPEIEVLPWEYNIDFRPHRVELKRHVTSLLPRDTIPLLTWENGKGFELDGLHGYLRDYSISQIGPAEVAHAQIKEADRRGMDVYCKVDCFATWQFGTTPYIPVPQQWQKRYDRLEEYGVDGTLESWSNGYKPNFISELRSWSCWTDPLEQDTLLDAFARRQFGEGEEDTVIKAWEIFSDSIQNLPDTGPSMGTNSSVSYPLFFDTPQPRMMTLNNSWWDEKEKQHWRHRLIPHWPYAHRIMVFNNDFTNRRNASEGYARTRSGIGSLETHPVPKEVKVLPVYIKYMLRSANGFEKGLKLYRKAAMNAPESKRAIACKEVLVIEQMQHMLRSTVAIVRFEDLRFQLMGKNELTGSEKSKLLEQMEKILGDEILNTESALRVSRLDSRLGYENEMDYVYTPFVIEQKLDVLQKVRDEEIPAFRDGLTN